MKKGYLKLSLVVSSLILINTTNLLAVEDGEKISIDTLFLYSQGASDKYNGDAETRINHHITTSNKIYKDSGLNIELNAVRIQKYEMDDSADSGTVLSAIQQDADVAKIRDEVGADEVVMYRPYANDGMCGLAYVNNGYDVYAYAHVTIDCGGSTTAHEVGHNMGLWHSAKQDPDAGYARGHGVDNEFVTVMAYGSAYNATSINKFSDPDLDCNGMPCGIEKGQEGEADAVRAILLSAPKIVNFRDHIDNGNNNNKPDDGDDGEVDDNGDGDNNNGDNGDDGDDDGTKKLNEAKKAYEDAKAIVADSKEELLRLKTLYTDKRDEYKKAVKVFKADIASYKELRAEYKKLIVDYRGVRAEYKQARKDYRAKEITKEEFLAVRDKLIAKIDVLKAYYTDTLKPAYLKLKEYRDNTLKPLRAEIKELRDDYKDYRKNVYKVNVQNMKDAKKRYDELKKLYS